MDRIKPPVIDWKAYYKDFCSVHGGDPVLYGQDTETGQGGYLLFRDGWKYDRSSEQGPEYPPPEDPKSRIKLIKVYWSIKLRVLEEEYKVFRSHLVDLVRLQQRRSASLYVKLFVMDEGPDGLMRRRMESYQVNHRELLSKLEELLSEIAYCKKMEKEVILPNNTDTLFSAGGILTELKMLERKYNDQQPIRDTVPAG